MNRFLDIKDVRVLFDQTISFYWRSSSWNHLPRRFLQSIRVNVCVCVCHLVGWRTCDSTVVGKCRRDVVCNPNSFREEMRENTSSQQDIIKYRIRCRAVVQIGTLVMIKNLRNPLRRRVVLLPNKFPKV